MWAWQKEMAPSPDLLKQITEQGFRICENVREKRMFSHVSVHVTGIPQEWAADRPAGPAELEALQDSRLST